MSYYAIAPKEANTLVLGVWLSTKLFVSSIVGRLSYSLAHKSAGCFASLSGFEPETVTSEG